ncbi:MAG: hypothetical protein JRJ19_14785, partial [Deltaproteobacteria bacterium]|nr:hypothetical protein [Deltaproteobacteria bacterium]
MLIKKDKQPILPSWLVGRGKSTTRLIVLVVFLIVTGLSALGFHFFFDPQLP